MYPELVVYFLFPPWSVHFPTGGVLTVLYLLSMISPGAYTSLLVVISYGAGVLDGWASDP